ncbi:MAG: DedA family protein [Phyllobacteriaceae bacterium]|nr:DedA family protein [Phyllobacteriaceae bacterium]
MTEWLLALVPTYGVWLLMAGTFLSCLALPIPSSMLMLAAGGFAAAGDLSLAGSAGGALVGAVAGDQVGYAAGRFGGTSLMTKLGKRAAPLAKATESLSRRGGVAVFLSRWLVSALGPYVNVVAGAAHQPWAVFTAWGIAGEIVWVGLYVGIGYSFTGNLHEASAAAVNALGFMAAGSVALGLGAWLFSILKSDAAIGGSN